MVVIPSKLPRRKVAEDFTGTGRKVQQLNKAHPEADEVLSNQRKNQLRRSKAQVEPKESDEMKCRYGSVSLEFRKSTMFCCN
jgi:hypothetical protein